MGYFKGQKEEAERPPLYQNQGGLPDENKGDLDQNNNKVLLINNLIYKDNPSE